MTMKAGKIWGQTELIHANGVLEFHRIEYKAGYKCSEHEHQYKWNGFYVESGKMIVRVWQDADQEGLVDETTLPYVEAATDKIKEAKKDLSYAKLNNCPTSPRKMRLVADLVRGQKAEKALQILRFSPKEASRRLEKLLLSAIANWQAKNEDADIESADLFVKEIRVDGGSMLKRLRPAPQGRAHRIRKRSNHVTVVIGALNNTQS